MIEDETIPASLEAELALLTEEEKEACLIFSFSEWSSGLDEGTLARMGIKTDVLERLVNNGLLEKKLGSDFAREIVDANKEKAEEIQSRLISEEVPRRKMTAKEREFLYSYENSLNVSQQINSPIRYRLSQKGLRLSAILRLKSDSEKN